MKKNLFLTVLFILTAASSKAQIWGDYLFYSEQNSTKAYLIDNAGTTFKTWTFAAADKTGYSSYLLPGGTILRTVSRTGNSFTGGPICGKVQKVDFAGNIVWDFVYSTADYCTHHDICPMPNGNVLLISYERKSAADVSALGGTFVGEMWPDKIVEVQPNGLNGGNIVWEWHIWDHTCQTTDNTKSNYVSSFASNPQLIDINSHKTKDWIHMNGVSYNEELDQVCFSSHNQNEIYIIDHSTTTAEAATHAGGKYGKGGDFLYRWGSPSNYGLSNTQILKVTHDAHWAAPGTFRAGQLSAYNNQGISTNASCADMIVPPLNANGTYNLTSGQAYEPIAASHWRHACNGYNSNMGGIQQLPNGQVHVTLGVSKKMYTCDSTGATIYMTKIPSAAVAKSFRYTSCYVNGTQADKPTITVASGVLSSSAATTYQWFYNGVLIAGATSQTYTPTKSGNYYVQTTNASNCESPMSALFSYIPLGIAEDLLRYGIQLYPNPANDFLHVDVANQQSFTTSIYDGMGRLLATENNNPTLDIRTYNPGIYFISIALQNGQEVKAKFVKD
jgi:Arylsulfotransferase (ASST)/Secretion system C-terminal sorting domain